MGAEEFFFRYRKPVLPVLIFFITILAGSCSSPEAKTPAAAPPPAPSIPVVVMRKDSTSITKDYTASLEGKVNVEVRSQVDGYLDKIFVDEGAFVKTGQPLFKIDDRPYTEQLNTAIANLHVAEANMNTAQIEMDKLEPLVKNNVISPIQLKTAESSYAAAKAMVEQARTAIETARINLNYTVIKASVTGYIGRIPKRIGNLVQKNEVQGLTTLSDISQVYAYFSLSEADFLYFNEHTPGNSMEQKIRNLRPVTLIMADGAPYTHSGRIDLVNGQFDKTLGAITLRATFPNPERLLRSGNTGKIRMEEQFPAAILVPVAATIDQQDKIFVFTVTDSNTLKRQPILISGKAGTNYMVKQGLVPGDKVVISGLDRVAEGTVIAPKIEEIHITGAGSQ